MGWFEERAGLNSTVAVVTGGAGGLGEAIVADLLANGVRPAVIDIDPEAVEKMRGIIRGEEREAIVQHGDVRDPDALDRLFAAVDERWGRLDTLVNVVGGTFRSPFVETTPKGWDALLRTNLLHVLDASQHAVTRMKAGGRGGSIINLTTVEAHRAAPGYAVYSAAKAAVEQFGRTLAVEVAPWNIRVNNVAPDFTPTPNMDRISRTNSSLSTPEGIRIAIPMARAGNVTDVSNCVVFLASRLSEYVTGSTLHPDGGTFASSGWWNWPDTGWGNNPPPAVVALLSPPSAGDQEDIPG